MLEGGRPGAGGQLELILLGVFSLWSLITGILGAAAAAKWHNLYSAHGSYDIYGFGADIGNAPAGANGWLAFVGLASFIWSIAFIVLSKGTPLFQSALAWLVNSCVLFVLWLTAAAAVAGEQGGLSCSGTFYGIPCGLGNASLAFAWIGWIALFFNTAAAGLYFWKRNDWKSRSQGGLAGPSSSGPRAPKNGVSAGSDSISRPMQQHNYPPA